jgi:hypothetical protein
MIILTIILLFLFGSCASSKRGCDGRKNFSSEMW